MSTVSPPSVRAVTTSPGWPRSSAARRAGVRDVAHRCPCGQPAVVRTAPRLPDGTPFPTLYYLTCARLASRIGTPGGRGPDEGDDGPARRGPGAGGGLPARARGLPRRARRHRAARHRGQRGGMPDRVKCLHVHVAHALAAGPGVNPFGDEALDELGEWWRRPRRPCVPTTARGRAPRDAPPDGVSVDRCDPSRRGGVDRERARRAPRARRAGSGRPRTRPRPRPGRAAAAGCPAGTAPAAPPSAGPGAARGCAARRAAPAPRGRTTGRRPPPRPARRATAATASGSRVTARSTSSAVTLPEPSQIELSGASR